MKKYILLAAKYEYTKVKKERKKEEKEKQDVVHNIDAASHVVPRNEASAPLQAMTIHNFAFLLLRQLRLLTVHFIFSRSVP
jgi:hypothetical protein